MVATVFVTFLMAGGGGGLKVRSTIPKTQSCLYLGGYNCPCCPLCSGPPRRRGRGGSLPQGLWVQGASSTNINILFIASLDVFKESPDRSSLQGSKSASRFSSARFPCFLPLLLALITDTWGLILPFCPWAPKTSRRPCLCYGVSVSVLN